MKWKMKRWMWIATVLGALGMGGIIFAFVGSKGPGSEVLTDVVKRGDLQQSVEATGALESVDEVDLSFDTTGALDAVFVRVGESVSAGDLLAELEAGERSAEYNEAVQALAQAKANLEQKYAGATAEEIALARAGILVAEASLSAARVSLSGAQADLVLTTAEEEVNVAAAENNLAQEHLQTAVEEDQANRELVDALGNAMIAARSALSGADEILGIDNDFANDAYDDILSALDGTALVDAENAYEDAKESLAEAEDIVYSLPPAPDDSALNLAADKTGQALSDASLTLFYTRRVLDATEIATDDFSSDDLSDLKSNIDFFREDVQNAQESLTSAETFRASVLTNNATRIVTAQDLLAQAQAERDSAVSAAEANVATAQAKIVSAEAERARAQAQLDDVAAPPRGVDVAALVAAVNEAHARLDAASIRLTYTQIFSPIDGVVTEIASDPGEQISAGTTVITVQTSNRNQFKIVVDVAESDIVKVAVGDPASMTFDAFGDDTAVQGEVADIDPAEKIVEGVVYYEVTIFIDASVTGLPLKPGMSADVTITTDSRLHALYVPQRAVLEREDGSKYVRIPRTDGFEERSVETGLRADEGKLEILSGLQEGETIVLSIRD